MNGKVVIFKKTYSLVSFNSRSKVFTLKLMGILKKKVVIKLFKGYPKLKQKPYGKNHFWARGYFVSTVGLDEEMIKKYVKYQEKEEKIVEENQQKFDFKSSPQSPF